MSAVNREDLTRVTDWIWKAGFSKEQMNGDDQFDFTLRFADCDFTGYLRVDWRMLLKDQHGLPDVRFSEEFRKYLISKLPEAASIIIDTVQPPVEEPDPLVREVAPPSQFPLNALSKTMRDAVTNIAVVTQAPIASAGVAVLASAAVAVQKFIDTRALPSMDARACSLFFVLLQPSGARKSTVYEIASAPILKWERTEKEQYRIFKRTVADKIKAWEDADKAYRAAMAKAARQPAPGGQPPPTPPTPPAGPKPEMPRDPTITVSDVTIDGLVKLAVRGNLNLALFSAEGGTIIAGYMMAEDVRVRGGSILSSLWDRGSASRVRADEDETVWVYDARLSMLLMAQPSVAVQWLQMPDLRGQGMMSRVLMAYPENNVGTRTLNAAGEAAAAAAKVRLEGNGGWYAALQQHVDCFPTINGQVNAHMFLPTDPRRDWRPQKCLEPSTAARALWVDYYNEIEVGSGTGGIYDEHRDLVNKAAENAIRIAAVMAYFENPQVTEIDDHTMAGAIELARYFVSEATRIATITDCSDDQSLGDAQALQDWLKRYCTDKGRKEVALREVYTYGPASFRKKAQATAAMRLLVEHGHVDILKDVVIDGRKLKDAWRLR